MKKKMIHHQALLHSDFPRQFDVTFVDLTVVRQLEATRAVGDAVLDTGQPCEMFLIEGPWARDSYRCGAKHATDSAIERADVSAGVTVLGQIAEALGIEPGELLKESARSR